MRVKIALNSSGGELDFRELLVANEDDPRIKEAAMELLRDLEYLSAGDSIAVAEIEDV